MGKSNRKKKRKAKDKKDHDEVDAPDPSAARVGVEASRSGKMKRKEYEREMRVLQGELVAMQEWVKATGASEPLPAPDVKMSKPPSHHGYIQPDSSKPKSRRRSRPRSIPG